MRDQHGVTLIELIMVIVVLSIVSTLFVSAYLQLPRTLSVDEDVQNAAQLAQACSEHILARRRGAAGYAGVASNMCTGIPALASYGAYNVADVIAAYSGAACPGGASCKQVTVTVTRGATTLAQTVFIVVN